MFSLLKQIIIYIYILLTKDKQRHTVIDQLRHRSRTQKDASFDKPGLPDCVDDIYRIPDGWSEVSCFSGFNRDGACLHCMKSDNGNELQKLWLHIPTIGTLLYLEMDDAEDSQEDNINMFMRKKRLTTEVIDPMRKWKITFRGHMKLINGEHVDTLSFVRFQLYWNLIGDPYDFWMDTPSWQLAGECSKLSIPEAKILLASRSVWFEQWGEIRGSIQVEDSRFPIRLSACRERKYIRDAAFENRIGSIKSQHIEIDGIAHRFTNKILEHRDGRHLNFGHLIFPSLESYHTTQKAENREDGTKEHFKIRACKKDIEVTKSLSKYVIHNDKFEMLYDKYVIDGRIATGLSLNNFDYRGDDRRKSKTRNENILKTIGNDESNVLLIDIMDVRCRNRNLVGGKASNLSLLHSFGYNVPCGFCVTTHVFQSFLDENPDLTKDIGNIENIIRELRFEDLKYECDKTALRLMKCKTNANIRSLIEAKILEMPSFRMTGVAVRSSAQGEDGEILSAAGQMDTVLGVKDVDNIIEAIKQCWASNLSYQSVEYRRQNGQVIMEGMGVIIQAMVASDVSGVMMTNDPVSGREDRILINACFGLGEAVVSGKFASDSFVIGVENNGNFSILNESIGAKSKRIDVEALGGTCIKESKTIEDSCLTNEDLYRLCRKGKSIENSFKIEQEIEWAIHNDELYILQTRPITSFEDETDDDLFHEFDTPLTGDRELITTCNLQEMMPGAATPLTVSYFVNTTSRAFSYVGTHEGCGAKRVYHPTGFVHSYGNNFLMGMFPLYVVGANGIGGIKSKVFLDIDFLGDECKNVSAEDIKAFKGSPFNSTFQFLKCFAKSMLLTDPKTKRDFLKWSKKTRTYAIGHDSYDSQMIYTQIDENKINLYEICRIYFCMLSNAPLSIIKTILMGNSQKFCKENKEDLSNLFLKVGTVSAEVPKAIRNLALVIKSSGLAEEFIGLEDTECLKRLAEDPTLKRMLDEFMCNHGHRGIRESEMMEKCWSQAPLKLVHILKSISQNGVVERIDDERNYSKIADIMRNFKTRLSPFKRWLIEKVFLKKAMQKVLDREKGKSMLVKVISIFKTAYWSLAKQMVMEGRIPEDKLIFFLTHREIGELIETRSPKLIRKAKRRMKIFPRQQDTRLERISLGRPKVYVEPDHETITPLKSSMIVEGLPVGSGETTGRACIIKKEEDVKLIKKGDILICRYTDVGWSPYFPMIGGLVTELGSFLSHGAVVARECGIPCVVNVTNATKILQTGDIVRIHGNKGTVEKLSTD